MELDVIENDHVEVKKYLQNFVPINYYRVLGDEYLYQIRATLLQTVSLAELYNPKYDKWINDLTVEMGGKYSSVSVVIRGMSGILDNTVQRVEVLEETSEANEVTVGVIRNDLDNFNRSQSIINNDLRSSVHGMVIGGRNLMINSMFVKGYRAWNNSVIEIHDHYIGKMHKVINGGIAGDLIGIYPLAEYQNMGFIEGNDYSISFYAFGSVPALDQMFLTSPTQAPIKLPDVVISTDLANRRHITFKTPIGGGGLGIIFGATAINEDDWFSISRIKVEVGTKGTDWTPAPEDLEWQFGQLGASIDRIEDTQVSDSLAIASTVERLVSSIDDNTASITEEKLTRADEYSALSRVTKTLESVTANNVARIKDVDETFTDMFTASATRVSSLEAETNSGKGRITTLEKVTASLNSVVASQSNSLNAKIEGVSVGGRNLLRNANYVLGYEAWGTASISEGRSLRGRLMTITNTGTFSNYFGITSLDKYRTSTIIAGKEYVLSFYAKGGITYLNDIWLSSKDQLPQKLSDVVITSEIDERYEILFTADFTSEQCSVIIGASSYATNSWFSVCAIKLEQGNKATDWTAAPEDTGEALGEVEANIEEFKGVVAEQNYAQSIITQELSAKTDLAVSTINNLQEVVSTNEESLATLESTLRAEYKAGDVATSGLISSESKIRADQFGTLSTKTDTISSTATDADNRSKQNTSSIQIQASSLNGVKNEYFVKVDNNKRITGFGIAADGATSVFAIVADRFYIQSPDSTNYGAKPFSYSMTAYTDPDTGERIPPGLYIESATIKRAAIDTLKIRNHAVTIMASVYQQVTSGSTTPIYSYTSPSLYLNSGGSQVLVRINMFSFDTKGQITVTFLKDGGDPKPFIFRKNAWGMGSLTENVEFIINGSYNNSNYQVKIESQGEGFLCAAYTFTATVLKR